MQSVVKHPGPTDGLFKTVVVGVDEHQCGRDATALAMQLLADGGSLRLPRVSVSDSLFGLHSCPEVEPGSSVPGPRPHAGAREDRGCDDQLRRVESSSVGRGLYELTCAEGADLLVVGSCRRGLLGRVMIEDEITDALSGVPCAVAISPFGFAQRPAAFDEIGVAYNGSPESEDALAVARTLALAHGSRLSAFQAVSVPSYLSVAGAAIVTEAPPLSSRRRGRESWRWVTSSHMPRTVYRPKSWRSTAPRWTCWWSVPATTARPGGSCTAARHAGSRAALAVRCSSSHATPERDFLSTLLMPVSAPITASIG